MKTVGPPFTLANFPACTTNSEVFLPIKTKPNLKYFYSKNASSSPFLLALRTTKSIPRQTLKHPKETKPLKFNSCNASTNLVLLGAVTVGVTLFVMGFDDHKALAFGPEGPLVEEFWDNMRRYALYALTVSTGVAYAVFQPILDLLKNPISAILILTIMGGSIYIVSQVLSAMVGVSNFSYDYGY